MRRFLDRHPILILLAVLVLSIVVPSLLAADGLAPSVAPTAGPEVQTRPIAIPLGPGVQVLTFDQFDDMNGTRHLTAATLILDGQHEAIVEVGTFSLSLGVAIVELTGSVELAGATAHGSYFSAMPILPGTPTLFYVAADASETIPLPLAGLTGDDTIDWTVAAEADVEITFTSSGYAQTMALAYTGQARLVYYWR